MLSENNHLEKGGTSNSLSTTFTLTQIIRLLKILATYIPLHLLPSQTKKSTSTLITREAVALGCAATEFRMFILYSTSR